MLKNRLIFTLLYSSGFFMLSRNFRLQKVGNLEWLNKHYNFQNISFSIDELIILDVSRNERELFHFCEHLKKLSSQCLIPLAAGGGIRSECDAEMMLHSGADKIVVNTILFKNPDSVKQLVARYGSQCVIASIDFKVRKGQFQVFVENGSELVPQTLENYVMRVSQLGVGEIYLNSIDKDGTGQGYVIEVLDHIGKQIETPVIMAGGAGNYKHLLEGISDSHIDAVATANLFNFIGDGLPKAREKLFESGIPLAVWNPEKEKELKNFFTKF